MLPTDIGLSASERITIRLPWVCRRNRVRLAERIGHAYFFKLYFP